MRHKMFLAALCVATVFFSDLIVAQENTTNEQKAILVTGAGEAVGVAQQEFSRIYRHMLGFWQ